MTHINTHKHTHTHRGKTLYALLPFHGEDIKRQSVKAVTSHTLSHLIRVTRFTFNSTFLTNFAVITSSAQVRFTKCSKAPIYNDVTNPVAVILTEWY